MRKRSIPVLLLALVGWVAAWRMTAALMLTSVGYKIGGPFSASTYLGLIGVLTLLSSLVGLFWLTNDFVKWIKGRAS
ncbi:MAG TPA: hypothetical protein VFW94_05200 [Candidatus Acidoferrales bacterium]|nr:hypothetical protein [Candidatus Acidoferrales bacterium]